MLNLQLSSEYISSVIMQLHGFDGAGFVDKSIPATTVLPLPAGTPQPICWALRAAR
jgi:hypothetical protein